MTWRPISTAPKDGSRILWFGMWKPFDIIKTASPAMYIFSWSSLMSDGSGSQWIGDGFHSPADYHVEWTHWMPLPEAPSTKARDSTVSEAPGQMNKLVPIDGSTGEKT
jgi:hypothetical protein